MPKEMTFHKCPTCKNEVPDWSAFKQCPDCLFDPTYRRWLKSHEKRIWPQKISAKK